MEEETSVGTKDDSEDREVLKITIIDDDKHEIISNPVVTSCGLHRSSPGTEGVSLYHHSSRRVVSLKSSLTYERNVRFLRSTVSQLGNDQTFTSLVEPPSSK